jgi:hypothetical protein
MKSLSIGLIVLVLASFAAVSVRAAATDSNDIERLLDAIARIESHCDPNAVGDGGRALGAYQIHRVYWEDGTRLLGVAWPHRDATDPGKARRVVRAYLLHYGSGKSLIEMARIHNGGPCGYKKKSTMCYARKILADGSLLPGLHGSWNEQQVREDLSCESRCYPGNHCTPSPLEESPPT